MFYKMRNLAFLTGLFVLITGGVFAQQARELRLGTTVNGNLRAGEEIWYSVRSTASGVITVETLGELDTYLEAYDASRNIIAEDDDSGENFNARVSLLSEAGRTYLFKLRFLYESESGPYGIRASTSTITELRLDTWVSRNLNSGEDQWFSVRPSGSGILLVETSGDLDTYLEVYDSSNKKITTDDDSGENLNAKVSILAEAGKTYILKLRCVGGSGFGPYRIRANIGAITELRMSTQVSRNLGRGEEQWFSVRSAGTGPLAVDVTGNISVSLAVFDSSNKLLVDNGSGNKVDFFAETGKIYYIKLLGYGDYGSSGAYNIRANAGSISELRFGTWVSGNLQGAETRWFNVRSSAGGVVVVETSGNTDTYLQVYDSSGSLISENDDGGVDYNARVEIFNEANKTYLVRLSQLGSDNSPYRILASFETIPADPGNTSRARAVPVRPGEAVQVFFRSSDESRWYRYDASGRGTMFTVQTSGEMDTLLSLYNAQENLIAQDDDSGDGLNALISETLGAGTVYIEVKLLGGRTGRTTLRAEAWQRL